MLVNNHDQELKQVDGGKKELILERKGNQPELKKNVIHAPNVGEVRGHQRVGVMVVDMLRLRR